jgi:8-oxo-dGTP pyrophosphatase MutT (NUDIX family)/diadenosine tetraphosphate (Ap4A) HIT family hydrolase
MQRTWPDDWEERRRGDNCPACAEGRPNEIPDGDRFYAGTAADAYLCRQTAARGYALVFWRGRHAADPGELTATEWSTYASEVRLVAQALEAVYRPAKLNLMTLGNTLPHLHTHIVPRYLVDPDPGRPPLFMMNGRTGPLEPNEYAAQLSTLRAKAEEIEAASSAAPEFGRAPIGAACVILDPHGRVLLVRHTYGRRNWELPGGGALPGEPPDQTAGRELREETGIRAAAQQLTGVYHEPGHYAAGMLHFVFRVAWEPSFAPVPSDDEIDEVGWFLIGALPRPISDFTERRIRDATNDEPARVWPIGRREWFT